MKNYDVTRETQELKGVPNKSMDNNQIKLILADLGKLSKQENFELGLKEDIFSI